MGENFWTVLNEKKVQWVPLFATGVIEIARECHTLFGLHLNILQKPI